MKRIALSFTLIICLLLSAHSQKLTVNKVIQGVPEDLSTATLIVPRYDFMDIENLPDGAPPSLAVRFNKEAKKANTTIAGVADKNYALKYKLASVSEVEAMKEEGYKYYMDMVLMPKGMKEPEKRAMVPSYDKYGAAHKMFNNRYTQFHYYFYIRDLETNDAYITSKMKGNWDVYNCMRLFFKQVSRDATSE
ncbi:MAG: hypothetical protein AAFY71_03895 [Bacteroidota bacterium]